MKKYMTVNSEEMTVVETIVARIIDSAESTDEMVEIARRFENILVEDNLEINPDVVEF